MADWDIQGRFLQNPAAAWRYKGINFPPKLSCWKRRKNTHMMRNHERWLTSSRPEGDARLCVLKLVDPLAAAAASKLALVGSVGSNWGFWRGKPGLACMTFCAASWTLLLQLKLSTPLLQLKLSTPLLLLKVWLIVWMKLILGGCWSAASINRGRLIMGDVVGR